MKKAFNLILVLCVIGLLYICYSSIHNTQVFEKEITNREDSVKARLMQIKVAEEAYKAQHPDGAYCNDFNVLIEFIRNGRIPKVMKVGELTDDQMEKGLTEKSAAAIVASGNAAAIASNGLQNFRRDTTWVTLVDSLYPQGFVCDSLRYIPFAKGDTFELVTDLVVTRSGTSQQVMQCSAPDSCFLKGMGRNGERTIINRRKLADDAGQYAGLRIGDLYNWNNNAGNWE